MAAETNLERLLEQIRACRVCCERPDGRALPHQPRPVIQAAGSARIAICGQAPGVRAHASGRPFSDPSGDRLRAWLDVSPAEFYDPARIAIVPMGFCFPGLDANGSDLPPRKECAPLWRRGVFSLLPNLRLIVLVGSYAQAWHIKGDAKSGTGAPTPVSETVRAWRRLVERDDAMPMIPLPHPSWRNSGWLKRNPWFAAEVVPELRRRVRNLL